MKRRAFGNAVLCSLISLQKFSRFQYFGRKLVIAFLVFGLTLLSGCGDAFVPKEATQITTSELPMVVQDGISMPHFPTADGQLNYARSGFTDKREKQAAFRAVIALFPEEKLQCGNAALGLAYLHLEPDYRFATALDIRQAVNDFTSILKQFNTVDEVVAKTHWYLGWIYTDLLGDSNTGINHYFSVANNYGDIPMNLSVAIPWANLVYPPDQPKPLKPTTPQILWSEIAFLEIIRNAPSPDIAIQAFNRLFENTASNQVHGFALKAMLENSELAPAAAPKIPLYLKESQNPYLQRQIEALATGDTP